MTRSEKNAIADIIRIYPYIYGLQDKIDKETERIVRDKDMPTKTVIAKLKDIENRRIDLCNLKVLYGIIEKELRDEFPLLKLCANEKLDCTLFPRAEKCIKNVGYDAKRVIKEFKYLFNKLASARKKASAELNASSYSSGADVTVVSPA